MTKEIVIRARKFLKNKLLDRRQFLIDVFTPDFSNVSKKEVTETVAKKFKVAPENVVIFGLKYKFGGGRATGFGLIYENKDSLLKFEPKHRLIRSKLIAKKETKGRRLKKEHKNKTKKLRGKAKMAALKTDKKKK